MKKMVLALCTLLLSATAVAETVTLQHQGLNISANLVRGSDNWQQGPVVLMTHGTLAHNRMEIMATLQALLQERGISSLAINLSLGLSDREGMYDCSVPHRHQHTDAVTEIGLWLEWLKGQGAGKVVLLGHSRGGNQTARFAAGHDSDTIRGVILIAPQTWDKGYEAKDYQKRYGKELAPLLAQAENLLAEGKGNTLLKPVDFIYCEKSAATAAAFVSYYREDPQMDSPTVIASIKKPVLVLAGSEDNVVKGLQEKMAAAKINENVQFKVIDGADHFFRDLYAEEVADEAQVFVEGLD